MRNTRVIIGREFASYFNSPIAYIFLIVFLLLNCGLYMLGFFLTGQADMRGLFGSLPLLLCFFIPAVSMRLWAEDHRRGTFELLMTLPMQSSEVMLGKYLSALGFYLVALVCTLPIAVMLNVLGNPDNGAIFSGYLGALLLGALYLAVGIFTSGLMRDQISAFILGVMACLTMFFLGTRRGCRRARRLGAGLRQPPAAVPRAHVALRADDARRAGPRRPDLFPRPLGPLPRAQRALAGREEVLMSDKRRKYRLTFTVATVLLSAVALFLIAVLGNFTGARTDLTSDKLYTLAPAAARILKDLEVPVQVRLYITPADKMPTAYKTLERDITEQLNDYARIADGKLQFSVHNPQDDEKLQEELIGKDIRPFQVQSVDKDEIGVKLVWCAMTIGYKDYPEEVVPRILPENVPNLETLVVVPIYRLTREKAPKVAVFAPRQELDPQMAMMYLQQGRQPPEPPDNYTLIMQLLQQEHYTPVRVELTPDVAHPGGRRRPAGAQSEQPERPSGLRDQPRPQQRHAGIHGRAGARVQLRSRVRAAAGRSAGASSPAASTACSAASASA